MKFLVFQDYPWNSWLSQTIHEILGFPGISMKFLVSQEYLPTHKSVVLQDARMVQLVSQLEIWYPDLSVVKRTLPSLSRRFLSLRERYLSSVKCAVSIPRSPSTEFRIVSLSSGQALSRSESTRSSAHAQWVQGPPRRPVVQMRMRSPAPRWRVQKVRRDGKDLEWSRRRENKYFLTEPLSSVFF